ncbi:MAG: THUMP domain-containing protein [Thermofilaceae archaeon]|nr:THUMP domain-containing protein [Thermofilaceae archaeon]MDW8003806.1 THUMP domain-containing protein [Thermofilaceae archaeon]
MKKVLVTTVPGLEDLLLKEIETILPGQGEIRSGRVIYSTPSSLTTEVLSQLITSLTLAEKVHLVLIEGKAHSLDDVKGLVRDNLYIIEGLLKSSTCFAVEAVREGAHAFTSVDVAREVGAAIQELEPRPPVSLDDPDLVFHTELIGSEFRLAIDLTPFISLRDRGYRVYVHPSSLNPVVARAMVKIAGIRNGEILLDPMCGGGTIVIEALLENASAYCIGFDVNPIHVRGARLNAAAAGVNAEFGVANAVNLQRMFRRGVDLIVTNPPYGIREKAVSGKIRLYESLIEGAYRILTDEGRLIILSPLKKLVERIAFRYQWRSTYTRRTEIGGLVTYIYLFKK